MYTYYTAYYSVVYVWDGWETVIWANILVKAINPSCGYIHMKKYCYFAEGVGHSLGSVTVLDNSEIREIPKFQSVCSEPLKNCPDRYWSIGILFFSRSNARFYGQGWCPKNNRVFRPHFYARRLLMSLRCRRTNIWKITYLKNLVRLGLYSCALLTATVLFRYA